MHELNLFFILRIIFIWENLFGKVRPGSFSHVNNDFQRRKWCQLPSQNSKGVFLVSHLNPRKKNPVCFHVNNDSKNEEIHYITAIDNGPESENDKIGMPKFYVHIRNSCLKI